MRLSSGRAHGSMLISGTKHEPMSKPKSLKSASGIRAIAQALGISVATVDRALHNRGRISEETRARVREMAKKLNYRPNLAARDLRLNRHFRISVHLPAAIAAFFDVLRSGIEEGSAAYRSALDLEFHRYARDPGSPEASIQAALDANVQGIIAVPSNTEPMARLMRNAQEKEIPVICVSTDAPESGRLTAITPYPYHGGCLAAEVLALRMKKRGRVIVLAGDLENLNQTEKVRGFRATLSKMAAGLETTVVETRDDPRQAYEGIQRCLREETDLAGLYVTGANSIAALTALSDAGCLGRFPIVTTDLFPELAVFIRNGAVQGTIYQCPEMQGSLAIRAMYQYLMEGTVPPQSIGVIPQLVMQSNLELYLRTHAPAMVGELAVP